MKIVKFQKDFFKKILPILIHESVETEVAVFGNCHLNIHTIDKTVLKGLLADICRSQKDDCTGCPIHTIYNGKPPMDCKQQPHIMLRLLQDKITCPIDILATQENLRLL